MEIGTNAVVGDDLLGSWYVNYDHLTHVKRRISRMPCTVAFIDQNLASSQGTVAGRMLQLFSVRLEQISVVAWARELMVMNG